MERRLAASAGGQNRQQAQPGPAASLTSFGSSFNHLQVMDRLMQNCHISAPNVCFRQHQLVARRGNKQGPARPSCFSHLLWKLVQPSADHAFVHTELPHFCIQRMFHTASADCQKWPQAHPGPAASLGDPHPVIQRNRALNHLQFVHLFIQNSHIFTPRFKHVSDSVS